MGYDIYGNNLRNGHCEVHPNVHEEYPCSVCIAENRTQESQYCDGNPAHCENSHYLGQAQEHIKELESRVKELILQLSGKESVIKELREWRDKAFQAHPNIDIDIEHIDG